MSEYLRYPRDPHLLLRKKRSIRRGLLQKKDLQEKRIAILGGSTTAEIRDMLELFLLDGGIRPAFYESEYNRYFEDIMFPNERLREFAPDAVYIHTSNVNITRYPSVHDTRKTVDKLLTNEIERYKGIWNRVSEEYGCPVI
ncbi:MAG: HAD family hydrolase, partial [Candidatus Omnitrophica bacterium]|nr:HAD family hydrolase [Candidatus Omnitrophota bacterium]